MSASFPSLYSRLDPRHLSHFVAEHWGFESPVQCTFFHSGESDGYRVLSKAGLHFLRVYRTRFSTLSLLTSECSVLDQLRSSGLPVSAPVLSDDGKSWQFVDAVEGKRAVVLFEFVAGSSLQRESVDGWADFGRELARLHLARIEEPNLRQYGLHELLNAPTLRWIDRAKEQATESHRIEELSTILQSKLAALSHELPVGFIHGDTAGGNAHINDKGRLAWFDFLWMGFGPWAWDIATFRRGAGEIDSNWEAFISGYQSVREITEAESLAIPLLAAVRCIFTTSLILDECDFDLQGEASPTWLDRRLKELNRLADRAFLPQTSSDSPTAC